MPGADCAGDTPSAEQHPEALAADMESLVGAEVEEPAGEQSST